MSSRLFGCPVTGHKKLHDRDLASCFMMKLSWRKKWSMQRRVETRIWKLTLPENSKLRPHSKDLEDATPKCTARAHC